MGIPILHEDALFSICIPRKCHRLARYSGETAALAINSQNQGHRVRFAVTALVMILGRDEKQPNTSHQMGNPQYGRNLFESEDKKNI